LEKNVGMKGSGEALGAMRSGALVDDPVTVRPRQPEGEKFHLGYRPALDGLRGVAILAVVVTHAKLVNGAGDVGVDIFFVLSGFLITSLLIEEWDKFHSVSLKRFYARRALRLLPALVVMIAGLVMWHLATSQWVAGRTALDGLITLFYSTNWALALGFRQPVHVFAHTWTLSIEEQFYLWWPIALTLLLRRSNSRGSLLHWVILGMFLLLIERVMIAVGTPRGGTDWLYYATEARADTLLVGCAAAIVLGSNLICWNRRARIAIKYLAWLVGVPGLLLIGIAATKSIEFSAIGLHITIGLFAVLILVEIVISNSGVLVWLMSWRWLIHVGKMSYGLYLWHYPIFCEVQSRKWPLSNELAIEVGLTAVATLASFYLIERPALKLKGRFSRLNETDTKQASVLADAT
jgi:peptidoglycan/LPS O-acetylase OafA/YrhL